MNVSENKSLENLENYGNMSTGAENPEIFTFQNDEIGNN